MKNKKKFRGISYSASGVAIGLSVFLFMQAGIPAIPENRSELIEFGIDEDFSEYAIDYNLGGEYQEPFLENGSYILTEDMLKELNVSKVVHGKTNPTYFFKKENKEDKEEELSSNVSSETTKSSNKSKEGSSTETKGSSTETKDSTEAEQENNSEYSSGSGSARITSSEDPNSYKGGQIGYVDAFNVKKKKLESVNVDFIADKFSKEAVLPLKSEMFNKTSGFGVREDPFEDSLAYHSGLDLAAAGVSGSEIYSVLDGFVLSSVPDKGKYSSGNKIVIEHDGFQTSYSHMNSLSHLKAGDFVKAGDVIGYVGTTGRSTGPHLHFEVGIGDLRVDPEIFTKLIKEGK